MDTEKVKDEGLTFMEEFERPDQKMTRTSKKRNPSGKKRRSSGKGGKRRSSGPSLSGTEKALISAGCAVALLAILLSGILVEARQIGNAVRAFHQVGTGMEGIAMIGEEGIVAVAQAKDSARKEAEKAKTEDREKDEEEIDESELIKVDMTAQTIKGDLKIKFLDSETGHIIEEVPFAARITSPDGEEERVLDDDKNGIIHLEDIEPGTYTVEGDRITGKKYRKYVINDAKHDVAVSNVLVYEAVDVSDEVKDQSEVDTAAEDNMNANDTPEEVTATDTVELVESTKSLISGGESYKEIPKSMINDPYKTASLRNNTGGITLVRASAQKPYVASTGLYRTSSGKGSGGAQVMLLSRRNETGETGNEEAGAGESGEAEPAETQPAEAESAEAEKAGAVNAEATDEEPKPEEGDAQQAEETTADAEASEKTPLTVEITGVKTPMEAGESVKLGYTYTPAAAASSLTWSSSGEYAPVSSEGVVTAVKGGGTTNITLTITPLDEERYAPGTATVSIEVRDVDDDTVSVSFPDGNREVEVGYEGTLNVKWTGDAGGVTWQAIPDDIIELDSDGSFKALKAGTATVTATSINDDSAKGTCNVTVTEAEKEVNDNAELKDADGNQVYVKDGEDYRRAVNSDYNSSGPFYVMTRSTEVYRYTGFQTINGKTYYYDSTNNLVRGEQIIGGVTYQFDEDGALMQGGGARGIDVSEYNGVIDWAQVKASGVEFAIIRLGYRGWGSGVLVEDSRFRQNVQGAAANGIRVGVYFVTQAVNEVEAVEEASMVLGIIRNYSVSYPVFLDVETSGGKGSGRADSISVATRTAVCNAFCRTIANSGYRTGIYANKTWLDDYIDTPQIAGYNIWVAQYHTEPTYNRTRYDMWQHTSSGSVPGIGGKVDLNICYTAY